MLAYIPYISIHGSYGVYFRNLKDLIPSSEWRFSVWSFAPPACSSAVLFSCLLHPPKKGLSLGDTVSISFHQFPTIQTIVSKHMILGISSSIRNAHRPGCQASIALRPTWSRVVSPNRRLSTLIVLEIPGDTLVIPHSDSLDGIGWFCSSTFFFALLTSSFSLYDAFYEAHCDIVLKCRILAGYNRLVWSYYEKDSERRSERNVFPL